MPPKALRNYVWGVLLAADNKSIVLSENAKLEWDHQAKLRKQPGTPFPSRPKCRDLPVDLGSFST